MSDLADHRRILQCGVHRLGLSGPLVMGIVNLTPDSFSDGGRDADMHRAIEHAQQMIDDGADLIDVGAESTRPGATPVASDQELERLLPFLTAMRDARVPLSVDTRKPDVMRRALDAGASMINDVAGFGTDDARAAVSGSRCALCVMHMRGEPATMQLDPRYDDVVAEVATFLGARADALTSAGVARERLLIDPGFGFGKTFEHNLSLLRRLDAIVGLGLPVLVGLSRKGLIGTITGKPVTDRVAGSVAAALVAVERGAAIVRVHDVAATLDAMRVWKAARGQAA